MSLSVRPVSPSAFPVFDTSRTVELKCLAPDRVLWHVCIVSPTVADKKSWAWARARHAIGHAAEFVFKCFSFWEAAMETPGERIEGEVREKRRALYSSIGQQIHPFGRQTFNATGAVWLKELPLSCGKLWAVPTRSLYPGHGMLHFARPAHAARLASLLSRTPLRRGCGEASGIGGNEGGGRAACSNRSGDLGWGLLEGEDERDGRSLRVGWLQRGPTRHSGAGRSYRHSEEVMLHLRAAVGVGAAESFYLHNLNLATQVAVIRNLDVIFTTHGSQGVVLPLVRPCTAVVVMTHVCYLLDQLAEYVSHVGGVAFFVHKSAALGDVLRCTLHGINDDGQPLSYRDEYAKREADDFDNITAALFVAEVLPAVVAAHRACLANRREGRMYDMPNDGIPRLGGPRPLGLGEPGHRTSPESIEAHARELNCHESAALNCSGHIAAYEYALGAVACERCLHHFRQLDSEEVCARAQAAAVALGINNGRASKRGANARATTPRVSCRLPDRFGHT